MSEQNGRYKWIMEAIRVFSCVGVAYVTILSRLIVVEQRQQSMFDWRAEQNTWRENHNARENAQDVVISAQSVNIQTLQRTLDEVHSVQKEMQSDIKSILQQHARLLLKMDDKGRLDL